MSHRAYIERLENARQALQEHTLDNLVELAAAHATEPAARTGIAHPDGRVSMSTADTRGTAHPSRAHSEGTMASALDREAHIHDRHVPLIYREHDR